jgi:serpin B
MMRQTEDVRHAELRSLEILELSYLGDDLSMLVLLPKRISGLRQLEASLSVENLDQWRRNLTKKKVMIFLPRFRMTSKFNLGETLGAMGMVDAFTAKQANFAGMDGQDDQLYIGAMIHRAFVEVNEEGTEAVAVTAIEMTGFGPSPPRTFRADHPFLFLIQDNQTESILFMGRVTDPTTSGQ